ncbi:DUF7282 domain-containing protein [Halosimplex amylolyticum]|uniref:DUF7282 domain-containing protein n=1 Tax=Halosimplex amylolyticum TaxID=3396616 RepID=UPI003F54668F
MAGRVSYRAVVVVTVAVVLATPLAVATVSAHGNHVAADSQVTSDGTVVVETVSALTPGFVVLRADDGGRPGEPVGSTSVARTPNLTFLTSVPVRIDPATWDEWDGDRTLWAVLHDDTNGNGEFEYGTDLSMVTRNPAASTRITVERAASGQARVLATTFDPLPLTDGALTVRQVDLPAAGHVVVRPVGTNDSIGSRSLAAGTHRNVSVPLDESFVAEHERPFRVRVVVHRDDGDGDFGPEDPPITAGDRPVETYLSVAPGNGTDDGPVINTPTVTTAPGESATPTPSTTAPATRTATDSRTNAPTGDSTPDEDGSGTGTAADGAGFGVALAALGVALALAAVGRSRRR